MSTAAYILVLDIGKTNIKLHVVNRELRSEKTCTLANRVKQTDPYPHADVDALWEWLLTSIRALAAEFPISAMSITTHGATAALVNTATTKSNGLVLPVLDYEYHGPEQINSFYCKYRPTFQETCSPDLPAGLNLGRQLLWQQHNFPDRFKQANAILLYPQYWVWRLTGVAVSEVSSLGCHTDLWNPNGQCYSSLVLLQHWDQLLPPIVPAWRNVATISEAVAAATGLPKNCRIHAGAHDSNASFLRFIGARPAEKNFCVVSTGTWVICMAGGTSLNMLRQDQDMLANVDVNGSPIASIRYMGGREFEAISKLSGESFTFDRNDVQKIIDDGAYALPNFAGGSGPFGERQPEVRGAVTNSVINYLALATLYSALMIDYCLDRLQVSGDIILVGSFLRNKLLCALLAQLRKEQPVFLSSDSDGTVRGAAQLADWDNPVQPRLTQCQPARLQQLENYKSAWRQQL